MLKNALKWIVSGLGAVFIVLTVIGLIVAVFSLGLIGAVLLVLAVIAVVIKDAIEDYFRQRRNPSLRKL